ISQQPAPVGTCPTVPGTFSVATTGTGPFTYQWQIQTTTEFWADLHTTPVALPCGGSAYASAPISALTHISVNPCPNIIGDSTYQVRCVITNPCGTIVSDPASLHLCMSDINCNGTIDIDDLLGVIGNWGATSGSA